jgi:hypothetical protein
VPEGRSDTADLARRASFALRNHLSSLMALSHVIEGDEEAVEALRATIVQIALDADVLVDLSLASADDPARPAPLAELLRESARPLGWLADLVGAPVTVSCPAAVDATFLQPREAVATGRRLIAGLIGMGVTEPIVLEAVPDGPGLLIAARCASRPLEISALHDPGPRVNDNDVQLDVLGWALGRADLRAELMVGSGTLAARVAPAG